MESLGKEAYRLEFCGDIYENFGEIQTKYFFDGISEEETSLLMPYFPCGILCGLSVVCDGEEIASAQAINIREIPDLPKDGYISLERLRNGLFFLKVKGVSALSSLEIRVTVCFSVSRRGQHLALSFASPKGLATKCEIFADFNIHGEVKKVISPTSQITVTALNGLCRISACNVITETFIIDIFFSDAPLNRIFVSRQPLQKNIGFCSFTPRLASLNKKRRKFDIHISFAQGNRGELISALAVVLGCVKKEDCFRLSVGGVALTEFVLASEKNIDAAMALACENQSNEGIASVFDEENTIIICNGTVFDPDLILSGEAFVILTGEFVRDSFSQSCVFVGKNESEFVIPPRFSAIYDKQLESAIIEPMGGIGVELLWDNKNCIRANSTCSCFVRHDIIPPRGLKIFNKRKQLIEEINFDCVDTKPNFKIIDVLYGMAIIKRKEEEAKSATLEERCLLRQEINEICLKNQIAYGDIALACVANGKTVGLLSPLPAKADFTKKHFREGGNVDAGTVIDLILKSQTADGVIADIVINQPRQLVFSTAVCLIALYLYKGRQYADFAKRSLDFLKIQDGFWAKTALDLWDGKEIDLEILEKKLEMKIMGEYLHELAIFIIKNHRRNIK